MVAVLARWRSGLGKEERREWREVRYGEVFFFFFF